MNLYNVLEEMLLTAPDIFDPVRHNRNVVNVIIHQH